MGSFFTVPWDCCRVGVVEKHKFLEAWNIFGHRVVVMNIPYICSNKRTFLGFELHFSSRAELKFLYESQPCQVELDKIGERTDLGSHVNTIFEVQWLLCSVRIHSDSLCSSFTISCSSFCLEVIILNYQIYLGSCISNSLYFLHHCWSVLDVRNVGNQPTIASFYYLKNVEESCSYEKLIYF
jgi:hypothetical protein